MKIALNPYTLVAILLIADKYTWKIALITFIAIWCINLITLSHEEKQDQNTYKNLNT